MTERVLILMVGMIQFVATLDATIVTAIGPDLAAQLAFPASHLGWLNACYGAGAAIAGIAGATMLDRFARRSALMFAVTGVIVSATICALAQGFGSLAVGRFLGGAFGGSVTALTLTVISDVVPPDRRGKAVGALMGAYSIATIVGTPVGLELSRVLGWRSVFVMIVVFGALAIGGALAILPPMRDHLASVKGGLRITQLVRRPRVVLAYAIAVLLTYASFLIIPNVPAFLLKNCELPRKDLSPLYMAAGVLSFIVMRLTGRVVDRMGSAVVCAVGCGFLVATLYGGFVIAVLAPVALALCFLSGMVIRNVACLTLVSKVPDNSFRAQFMSMHSALQSVAMAAGSFTSVRMLSVDAQGSLVGMDHVAWLSISLGLILPILVFVLDRHARHASRSSSGSPAT